MTQLRGLGLGLGLQPRHLETGVPFSLPTFLKAQSDGFYFDLTNLSSTWQDTSATTPADDVGEAIGRINDLRGAGTPRNGLQSTSANRPLRQSNGAQFDNSNDNWLTDYVGGSGDNFVVAVVDVPTTIGSTQYVCGGTASGISASLGFNSSGTVRAVLGTQLYAVPTAIDNRQQTATIGMSWNSSVVKIMVDNEVVMDTANIGGPSNTLSPWRVGALNSSGVAAGFFGGSVRKIVAGRQLLDTANYRRLRNSLHVPLTSGNIFYMEGDSFVAGSGGAALIDELRLLGFQCVGRAISGATIYQQRSRVLSEQRFRDLVFVLWDGSPAGYVSVSGYMSAIADMVACFPSGKFIIIPPVRRTGQTVQERNDTALIQAAIAATYPNNYLDAQAIMVSMAVSPGDDASVAAGCVPTSTLQGDGLHPTVAAEKSVALAVAAMRTSKGW